MRHQTFLTALLRFIPALLLLSCSHSVRHTLSQEECARLVTVPDSCLVDTIGITGTIFPSKYSYPSIDSTTLPPVSTWTPTHQDVLKAERIFQAEAAGAHHCLDSNVQNFYRQYIGQGNGNIILIHGIRKSHEIHLCGHRSFWINVYDNDCSTFDAEVDLLGGSCTIDVKSDY
ncbi:MAG: hypothetical protein JXA71_07805 [Chitinispirillaceae bacterium]|nr:hypothetical protein [Chitinispirillaceae bacterium]